MWLQDNWNWFTKAVLFFTGLGLVIWESAIRQGETRPEFLILYGGMMGLPAFIPKKDTEG